MHPAVCETAAGAVPRPPAGHCPQAPADGCRRRLAVRTSTARRRRLAALAEQVRRLQAARRSPLPPCPSGLAELDAALGGGFVRGAVHELLAPAAGAPARSLALWVAARSLAPLRESTPEAHAEAPAPRQWVLYIDTTGDFYPPAAASLGLLLRRLLIVRAPRIRDAWWACELALRCQAVATVILPTRAIDACTSRRLQLAAETGGVLGFLLCPTDRSGHTFAATRLRLDPVPDGSPTPRLARDGAAVGRAGFPLLLPPPPVGAALEAGLTARRVRITPLKLRAGRPLEPFELALPFVAAEPSPPLPPLPTRSLAGRFPTRPAWPAVWAS